jgi:hypothetical protein
MAADESFNTIEEIEWAWLGRHLERDAVIVVADDIDLEMAAQAVAADDSGRVSAWIAAGQLNKPTPAQIAGWNADPATRFRMRIVQPYVLIQGPVAKED